MHKEIDQIKLNNPSNSRHLRQDWPISSFLIFDLVDYPDNSRCVLSIYKVPCPFRADVIFFYDGWWWIIMQDEFARMIVISIKQNSIKFLFCTNAYLRISVTRLTNCICVCVYVCFRLKFSDRKLFDSRISLRALVNIDFLSTNVFAYNTYVLGKSIRKTLLAIIIKSDCYGQNSKSLLLVTR